MLQLRTLKQRAPEITRCALLFLSQLKLGFRIALEYKKTVVRLQNVQNPQNLQTCKLVKQGHPNLAGTSKYIKEADFQMCDLRLDDLKCRFTFSRHG